MTFEEILYYFKKKYAVISKSILLNLENDKDFYKFSENWYNETIHFLNSTNTSYKPENAVDSFARICLEHIKYQSFLIRKGYYTDSAYEDINQKVYQSEEVMNKYYLPGLRLSYCFWRNHYTLWLFYENWVKEWKNPNGDFLEVGIGHGSYINSALCNSYVNADGYDISNHSVKWTQDFIKFKEVHDTRYTLFTKAYEFNGKQYDYIVCGELLEHIPNPENLILELKKGLKQNGEMHLTTVINSAAIDHLYLFKTVDEIRNMIDNCGLSIEKELILPLQEMSEEKLLENKVPINYGVITTWKD
ncbi:MAG: methyltransferase domain-containing protein [Bacteroidia bacterium]|nr:methyltransferase domain-containing protein [Bacteroidia bacterium]